MKSSIKIIIETLKTLLEIVFPSTSIERKVRKMSLEDFNSIKDTFFDQEKKILSFFRYKNPLVREAIRQIKYKENRRLVKIIALIICSELLEEISDLSIFQNFQEPVLVPVPMSNSERKERRYNQVELLINEIVKISDGIFKSDFNLLKKIKNTKRQTGLKREERLENVKGAFEADFKVLRKNIILVDDVTTTGATISECRNVLSGAGVRNIFSLTIAI